MFFREVASKFDAISPSILSDRYKKLVLKATSGKPEPTQSSHMHDVMVSIKKGGSLSRKHTPAGATIHHIRQRLLSHDMIVVLKSYTLLHYVFRNANHAVFQRLALKTLVDNPYAHHARPSRSSWTSFSSRTSRTTVTDESFHRTDLRYALPIPAFVAPDLDPLTSFVVAYATYLSARLRLKAQADFPPVRCTDTGDRIVSAHFEQADQVTVIKAADELITTTDAALAIPFSAISRTTTSTMIHLKSVLNPTLHLLSRDIFLLWRTTCNTIMRMVSLYFEMEKQLAVQALNVYSRFVATTARAAKIFPILARLLPRWRPPTHSISLDLAPSMQKYVQDGNSDTHKNDPASRHPNSPNEHKKFEKSAQTDTMEISSRNHSFSQVGLQDLLYTLPAVMHALDALFGLGANGFPKCMENITTITHNNNHQNGNNNNRVSSKLSRAICPLSEISSASSADSTTSINSQIASSSADNDKKNTTKTTNDSKRFVGHAAVRAIMTDVQRLWHTLENGIKRLEKLYFMASHDECVRCLAIYTEYVRLCEEAQSFFLGKFRNSKLYSIYSHQNHNPPRQLHIMRKYLEKLQLKQQQHHHPPNIAQLNSHLRTTSHNDLLPNSHLHSRGRAIVRDNLYSDCAPSFDDDIE